MLTIKAPIQLHIGQGLTGAAEAFSRRIRGNYDLLGAHFTPKELLFLLTAPPELPEDLGGMTTLVNQHNAVDVRSVTMDVVNNVVNRILLDGTEQFTYQDQVYITTVLNRLGITNVAQFMEQVRRLRLENESTVHMTQLYREELEHILERQLAGEDTVTLPLAPSPQEEEARTPDPCATLCMEIVKRLDTRRLYERFYAYQRSWSMGIQQFRNQELKLSEQLRVSNTLALAEMKQQIFQYPQLHFQHHVNQYETGELLEAPRDEAQVLSQAAVAALVSAVDNTVVSVLHRPQLQQAQWVRIENALWQLAENSLSRFERYHTQPVLRVSAHTSQQAWNNYVQELEQYRTLYQKLYPQIRREEPESVLPGTAGEQASLTHVIREDGEEPPEGSVQPTRYSEEDTVHTQLIQRLAEIGRGRPGQEQTVQSAGETAPLPDENLHLTHLSQIREGEQHLEQRETTVWESQEQQVSIRHLHQQFQSVQRPWPPVPSVQQPLLRREWERRERELRQEIRSVLETGPLTVLRVAEPSLETPLREIWEEPPSAAPDLPPVTLIDRAPEQEDSPGEETAQWTALHRESHTALHTEQSPVYNTTVHTGPAELTHPSQMPEEEQSPGRETTALPGERPAQMAQHQQHLQQLQSIREKWTTQVSQDQTVVRQEQAIDQSRQMYNTHLLPGEEPRIARREGEEISPVFPPAPLRDIPPQQPGVPPVSLTPAEAEEQAPEALIRQLERIDRHNRTLLQTVQQDLAGREPTPLREPDLTRTMQDALRAMEDPERILREVYRSDQQTPTVHRVFSPQEEALLRQAPPEERALYEAVLTYQKDPAAALQQGLLRPENLGSFLAQLQKAERTTAPLEHVEREMDAPTAQAGGQTVLERFYQTPQQRVRQAEAPEAPPPAVKFVHKQAQPDVTEELLEQLQQQRSQRTVLTDSREQVTRTEQHQVDVNQIERKVVTQTTEDITELVNRTLAQQMRSISDQVYRQMEKRLQLERSRRGRF